MEQSLNFRRIESRSFPGRNKEVRLSFCTDCRMCLEDDKFHREGKGRSIVCQNRNLNVYSWRILFVENGYQNINAEKIILKFYQSGRGSLFMNLAS